MKHKYTTIKISLFFVFFAALFISACQNELSSSFEDSLEPYMELESIENAENAIIKVSKGESKGFDSYFAFDLNNTPDHGLVRPGLAEGWCVEWNKAIAQNDDIHGGVKMYSTKGNTSWKPANYLMNIKDDLQSENPDITYREIQVALWSLIETPAFDLNEVLENGTMPARMMLNGEPNFNVNKVGEIVNRVRNEVTDFEYGPNKRFIVFARTEDSQQNGGITTCSEETAWADGSRFNTKGGNWATYTEYPGVKKTVTLYAGQTQDIGTVIFEPENGSVKITISLNEYGEFQDVEENVKIQDYSTAPMGNPQIGQFDYKFDADTNSKTFSTILPTNSFFAVHVDAKGCE